jgi:hypothetical protein|tara:strand:+ start:811 stop:975 length:165 start_codon:yes stop_codon:yes gene_type:complete
MENIKIETEYKKKQLVIRIFEKRGVWLLIKRVAIVKDVDGYIDVFVHNVKGVKE